jgi:hypothetical protein
MTRKITSELLKWKMKMIFCEWIGRIGLGVLVFRLGFSWSALVFWFLGFSWSFFLLVLVLVDIFSWSSVGVGVGVVGHCLGVLVPPTSPSSYPPPSLAP